MLPKLLTQIFGSRNDRLLKQYRRVVDQINAMEPAVAALDDDALKAKTQEFRERLAKGTTLDDLLQRTVDGIAEEIHARRASLWLPPAADAPAGSAPPAEPRTV